jgi:predicted helicase
MKIDMILTELGYQPTATPPRLSVFLTNSLEEGDPVNQSLPFAQWLSNEVKAANTIKRDMPIMCVIGNPPYSGVSQNMGKWITGLIDDYKYVDGVHFGERKHWLHDDYVKFIRLSEHLIEKNGEGVIGFITNHGYLDNPTFRGMRWHLLQTFDKIYVLDLHGNAKKSLVAPDGSPDKNVFDIQQGVSIIICIKKGNTKNKKLPAEVVHGELWGTREIKYQKLFGESLSSLIKTEVKPSKPMFSFSATECDGRERYDQGFQIGDLFQIGSMGVQTSRDGLAIAHTRGELVEKLNYFTNPQYTDLQIRTKFFGSKKASKYLQGDSRGWRLSEARKKINTNTNSNLITQINYRPFDTRYIYFSGDLIDWPREKVMQNFLLGDNLSLLFPRQLATGEYHHAFITNKIAEMCVISNKTKEQNVVYPLYIYPTIQDIDQTRRVNFDPKVYNKIQNLASDSDHGVPNEINIFDYIYGVLHQPSFRETYAEFLKKEFPRIPWPISPNEFWTLSKAGEHLRKLHLMEPEAVGEASYPFKGAGSAVITDFRYKDSKVWINETQYFDEVPETAWDFFIGSYQPAQKWLKDRKNRALSFEDVKHYQNIIKILLETERIMMSIDQSLVSN